MLPIIVLPVLMFTILMMLPFLDAWITGDKREHHLLRAPAQRADPHRADGRADDVLRPPLGRRRQRHHRDQLRMSINPITYLLRFLVFVGPVIAFLITRRWCISLQRHGQRDGAARLRDRHHHALPEGGYSEQHLPICPAEGVHAHRHGTATRSTRSRATSTRTASQHPASRKDALRARLSHAVVRRQRRRSPRPRARGGRTTTPSTSTSCRPRLGRPRRRRPPVRRPPLGGRRDAPRRSLTPYRFITKAPGSPGAFVASRAGMRREAPGG